MNNFLDSANLWVVFQLIAPTNYNKYNKRCFIVLPSWSIIVMSGSPLTDKGLVFGTLLSESSIAQIYQLIEFLTRSEPNLLYHDRSMTDRQNRQTTCNFGAVRLFPDLHVEGLFRVPGNIIRQQSLKELLNSGANVDLESGDFHPNDAATLLKSFLGELSEPLLTHRHFHAHLKIAGRTFFLQQSCSGTFRGHSLLSSCFLLQT